jgi:hypothetical protein
MKTIADLHSRITHGLNDKARTLSDALARGNPRTFEEYKAAVGRIGGLRDAADIVNDAFHAFLEGDDDVTT